MSTRCIFQGELGEIRTPDVLTFVDMLGKTGTLEVERQSTAKRIYWERGEIVFADSDVADETVGEYLATNGWVPPEALVSARAETKDEDGVVKALIRDDLLDPAILPRAVKSLVLDIVYSLFEWEHGAFRFIVTPDAHASRMPLKTSVLNVIMEGSRRMDEWRRIREAFPHDGMYPAPAAADDSAVVNLPPLEQEILGHVDGRRAVPRIIQQVRHDRFTVLGALLTLLNAGLISVSEEPAPTPAAARLVVPEPAERESLDRIVTAFNAIFAGLHQHIARVKGDEGRRRFEATLEKASFQRTGVFDGARFAPDGTLPLRIVIENVGRLPHEERLTKLKGSLDRLLAQQVLQMDTSYANEDKKAISDLIAREKARLSA